ncbi:hypothetical protein KA005_37465 [bacterium]|nr:hypothetical protein [bacterium]
MRLEVVPVEILLRHEETFSDVVDKFILEFKNWVYLQNPIIIDENNIVLDGNHRAPRGVILLKGGPYVER